MQFRYDWEDFPDGEKTGTLEGVYWERGLHPGKSLDMQV